MSQHDPVSAAWRAHRAYLVDLAFRMVGDIGVAEDMVQEAFSRLLRAPVGDIDDERGWLIVVTSRLCLDHIKSASTRRERPQDIAAWHDGDASVSSVDPADRVTLDDEVRLALLIMLERLGPAERVVFVLHEIFGLPYQQIARRLAARPPHAGSWLIGPVARSTNRALRPAWSQPSIASSPELSSKPAPTETWTPCSRCWIRVSPARSTPAKALSSWARIGLARPSCATGVTPPPSW